jgi:hypothetical protein
LLKADRRVPIAAAPCIATVTRKQRPWLTTMFVVSQNITHIYNLLQQKRVRSWRFHRQLKLPRYILCGKRNVTLYFNLREGHTHSIILKLFRKKNVSRLWCSCFPPSHEMKWSKRKDKTWPVF